VLHQVILSQRIYAEILRIVPTMEAEDAAILAVEEKEIEIEIGGLHVW
jgi:hypothetical protein